MTMTLNVHLLYVANNVFQLKRNAIEIKLNRKQRLTKKNQIVDVENDQQKNSNDDVFRYEHLKKNDLYVLFNNLTIINAINMIRHN